MKRIRRRGLERRESAYLARKAAEVTGGAPVEQVWKGARATKAMDVVFRTLCTMGGVRARCMFCGDSRGTDIEHYWPKVSYPDKSFQWENMLLACAGCNRKKGERFPLDEHGKPLLVNPVDEEPWRFLIFDDVTGRIEARWRPDIGAPDPRGSTTAGDEIVLVNLEAIAESRLRTKRGLQKAVRGFLASERMAADRAALLEAIADHDAFGLVCWYFSFEGMADEPFRSLRSDAAESWQEIQARFCG